MSAKKNNNEVLMNMVHPKQDYENMFKNATFSFYGAFGTMEDFVMREEIELLHTICEANGFEWFKCAIRMGRQKSAFKRQQTKTKMRDTWEETPTKEHMLDIENIHYSKYDPSKPVLFPTVEERFDKMEFLKANCPRGSTVYLCGPPVMNTTIYKNLRDIGFDDYDIYII